MKTSLSFAAFGLAALVLLTGCQPPVDNKPVTPPSNLSTATTTVRTKAAATISAVGTAMSSMGNPKEGDAGVTVSGDTMTVNLTNGAYHVVGSMTQNKTTGIATFEVTITLTNASDGKGGVVSGTMHEKGTMNTNTNAMTIAFSGTFDVTPAGGVKSTVGFDLSMSGTAGGNTQPTVTGTVTLDGISYDITK